MNAPSALPGIAPEQNIEARHLAVFRRIAFQDAGIELDESKQQLLLGRLLPRLRANDLADFDAYCALLETDCPDERAEFLSAITTNVTAFFREAHHFDFLRSRVVPQVLAGPDRRLRVWSAACSTGQEAYSIAMTLADAIPQSAGIDWKILATDIDTRALAVANEGVYHAEDLPTNDAAAAMRPWLTPVGSEQWSVSPLLKDRIFFREVNLNGQWPMNRQVDVIFCRNVIIYFSDETRNALVDRFARILTPNGHLFIGHSEAVRQPSDAFVQVAPTTYRRIGP